MANETAQEETVRTGMMMAYALLRLALGRQIARALFAGWELAPTGYRLSPAGCDLYRSLVRDHRELLRDEPAVRGVLAAWRLRLHTALAGAAPRGTYTVQSLVTARERHVRAASDELAEVGRQVQPLLDRRFLLGGRRSVADLGADTLSFLWELEHDLEEVRREHDLFQAGAIREFADSKSSPALKAGEAIAKRMGLAESPDLATTIDRVFSWLWSVIATSDGTVREDADVVLRSRFGRPMLGGLPGAVAPGWRSKGRTAVALTECEEPPASQQPEDLVLRDEEIREAAARLNHAKRPLPPAERDAVELQLEADARGISLAELQRRRGVANPAAGRQALRRAKQRMRSAGEPPGT